MKKHSMRLGHAAMLVCAGILCTWGWADAQRPTAKSGFHFGYIVLGPAARKEFGASVSDTVPEIRRSRVPAAVGARASDEARRATYDVRCSRFFRASYGIVVLLRSKCDKSDSEDDGERLLALRTTGELIGRVFPSLTREHYMALEPANRTY